MLSSGGGVPPVSLLGQVLSDFVSYRATLGPTQTAPTVREGQGEVNSPPFEIGLEVLEGLEGFAFCRASTRLEAQGLGGFFIRHRRDETRGESSTNSSDHRTTTGSARHSEELRLPTYARVEQRVLPG